MSRRQLPAGKILELFLFGFNIGFIAEVFNAEPRDIEAALRRQIARTKRGGQ